MRYYPELNPFSELVNFFNRVPLAMAVLFLLLASLLFLLPAAADQGEDKTTAPSAVVSIEHLVLSQNESARVEVWFSNPSPNEMAVDLTISNSSLIKWLDEFCQKPVTGTTQLGKIAAASSIHQTFCMKAAPEVIVGDYNVLFSFVYRTLGQPPRGGLVSIEKQVRLSFLGSDSVAGIPLAFSCFIVPGFLFWIALKLTRGLDVEPQLGDKMIYSVIVSLAIIVAGNLAAMITGKLVPLFSLSSGVSTQKLVWLSLIGIVAGLALGGGKRAWTWYGSKKLVAPTDSAQAVLKKLLDSNRLVRKPLAIVRLNTDERYEGALCAQTNTHTVLIGWFSLEPPSGKAEKIRQWEERHRLTDIVHWAESNKVEIKPYRTLRRKQSGNSQDTSDYMRFWKNEEVEHQGITAGKSPEEPLVIF